MIVLALAVNSVPSYADIEPGLDPKDLTVGEISLLRLYGEDPEYTAYSLTKCDFDLFGGPAYDSSVFIVETEVPTLMLNAMWAYWKLIPVKLRDAYARHGTGLHIVSSIPHNGGSDGCFWWDYGRYDVKIELRYCGKPVDKNGYALVHEYGHFLEWLNYGETSGNGISSIWRIEVDAFNEAAPSYVHNTSTPKEYYAQAFALWCINPGLLEDVCPLTFDYLNGQLMRAGIID